jgi:hypothetical protein
LTRFLQVFICMAYVYMVKEGGNNIVTCWVCHATNNFTWVSDLANLYWTLALIHLTITVTCSITTTASTSMRHLNCPWPWLDLSCLQRRLSQDCLFCTCSKLCSCTRYADRIPDTIPRGSFTAVQTVRCYATSLRSLFSGEIQRSQSNGSLLLRYHGSTYSKQVTI